MHNHHIANSIGGIGINTVDLTSRIHDVPRMSSLGVSSLSDDRSFNRPLGGESFRPEFGLSGRRGSFDLETTFPAEALGVRENTKLGIFNNET